jgi:hypothetical protein
MCSGKIDHEKATAREGRTYQRSRMSLASQKQGRRKLLHPQAQTAGAPWSQCLRMLAWRRALQSVNPRVNSTRTAERVTTDSSQSCIIVGTTCQEEEDAGTSLPTRGPVRPCIARHGIYCNSWPEVANGSGVHAMCLCEKNVDSCSYAMTAQGGEGEGEGGQARWMSHISAFR